MTGRARPYSTGELAGIWGLSRRVVRQGIARARVDRDLIAVLVGEG